MSDDLYDDLEETTKVAATERIGYHHHRPSAQQQQQQQQPQPQQPQPQPHHKLQSLPEQVEALQMRVVMLEKQNETLQRNIGTLYRTAVAELSRKDAQIAHLQQELLDAATKR
jgi:predicted RNase H-like nuclease (RuvC/YqgF family)